MILVPNWTGSTNAGGTGNPSIATRARLAALAPISSAEGAWPIPAAIVTTSTISASFSSGQIRHDMRVQEITDRRHSVGSALECAPEFEDGEARFQVEVAAKYERGDGPFRRVGGMLKIDEPRRAREGIFAIQPLALGHDGGRIEAGRGGLCTSDRGRA